MAFLLSHIGLDFERVSAIDGPSSSIRSMTSTSAARDTDAD
ncbi:hypothetical protein [Rhizobium sp. RHZ01]